jgi:hypothetical protein
VPPSSDARTILDGIEAMRTAIRAVRPSAQPGDLFDAASAELLRNRIQDALVAADETTAEILHRQREPQTSAGTAPLVPNAEFPWAQGSYLPPVLFEILPTLPPELQFRTVGRDLVLLDIDASMVVDVLVDALPPEEPDERPGTRWASNSTSPTRCSSGLSMVTGSTSLKHVIRPVSCQWALLDAPRRGSPLALEDIARSHTRG